MRLLQTILENFFSERAIREEHLYSESGIYYCPDYETLQEFQKYVDELPHQSTCELFGLHDNVDLIYLVR